MDQVILENRSILTDIDHCSEVNNLQMLIRLTNSNISKLTRIQSPRLLILRRT